MTEQNPDLQEVTLDLRIIAADTVSVMQVPVGHPQMPTAVVKVARDEDGKPVLQVYAGAPFDGSDEGLDNLAVLFEDAAVALRSTVLREAAASTLASRTPFQKGAE